MEADEFRAIQVELIHFARALDGDQPIGAVVLDRALGARSDGQFLGAEKLLALDFAIDDPAVHAARLLRALDGNGFKVMVVLEMFVRVACPIQLIHQVIQIVVIFLRHILDQERPRHFAAFDQRLIHAEDIAAPLRLIGAEGTRRM